MPREEPPSAVTVACPGCEEETLHSVLHGAMGTRGEQVTLDATVQCTECEHIHHVVLRQAKDVEVAAILSHGGASRKTRLALPADEEVRVGDVLVVDGLDALLTGIELREGQRRAEKAAMADVGTLWLKEFEETPVRFAINLGHRTITQVVPAQPQDEFSVGEERLFGRLRVTVHAIKTRERLLRSGSAIAGDIVRVFAKPTPLAPKKHRPEKRVREQLREREERRARRGR